MNLFEHSSFHNLFHLVHEQCGARRGEQVYLLTSHGAQIYEARVQINVSQFAICNTFKRACDSEKLKNKQNCGTKICRENKT